MNHDPTQRIGLIAGAGDVPVYFAQKASKNGIRLVSIALSREIGSRLAPFVEKNYSLGIGQTNKIFRTLKDEHIRELFILGKVDKSVIFQPRLFDLRAIQFFRGMKNKEDKTLMVGVIRELEKEGFTLLDQREFLREIFPDRGLLSRRKPTKEELEDIRFGLPIARKLADMEIGQTVVVKDKTVVAVEAVEGTDRAIERGCMLARGKAVVIKVSRTNQDYRYDSPGVGPQTVEELVRGGAAVLALEAERVMVVEQLKVVQMADRAGMSLICV